MKTEKVIIWLAQSGYTKQKLAKKLGMARTTLNRRFRDKSFTEHEFDVISKIMEEQS